MARIFVSHSSLDAAPARDVLAWLKSLGFDNAFLDIDDARGIRPGDEWEARLYAELAACSAVVLLVTPNWLASKWCFAEFVHARASGKAIFPVILTPGGGQAFADDLQRVDFATDAQGGRERLAARLRELAVQGQRGFDWNPQRPPYPGLPAFEADDAAVYFGRDPEVQALREVLRARRRRHDAPMVAVLGASGSGKSSLVRAGLLPRLAKFEREFVVLPPLRPGADPVAELAKALAEAEGRPAEWRMLHDSLAAGALPLADVVTDLLMAAGRREGTLLVTVDQAEELFTSTPAEGRAAFAALLRGAAKLPVVVLLTLRSDHLGELQQWAGEVGAYEAFSLPPLPRERMAEVIEGPARVAGVTLAPGLVEAIVADAGGPDAMPLLAFTLRELWARATADAATDSPVIRLADYQALGDEAAGLNPLENAVRRRADERVAPLDGAERRRLREAFVGALVRIDDQGGFGRRVAAWDELDPAVQPDIARFVDARLLVARSADGGGRQVEVAHESLLRKWPLLAGWLDDERGFLIGRLQLQRALDDWAAAPPAQRESALLQGLMLERARLWAREKAGALTAAQREFIAASGAAATARARAARRRRLVVGSVGGAALLAIAGLGLYLRQERQASAALAVEVDADRWLQRSAAALAYGQPDRAQAQAARAFAALPGAKTRSALWQAEFALPPQWQFSVPAVAADGELPAAVPGAISALAWTPAGDGLLVGDRQGALHGLRAESPAAVASFVADRQRPPSKDVPEAVLALQVRADGARIAVLEDGRVLRQAAGADRFVVLAQAEPLAAAALTAGGVLALTQAEGRLLRLDCSAAACEPSPQVPALQGLRALAAGPAERFAAIDEDGQVLLGDGATATPLALPAGLKPRALALDGPSGRLALGAADGELLVLDGEGRELARGRARADAVTRLAWAPGGEILLANCERDALCVHRVGADGVALDLVLPVRGGGSGAIAVAPDGRRLAGGDVGGRVHVWELQPAAARSAVLWAAAPVADLAVPADGRWLAAADVQGRVTLWDLASLRPGQRIVHPVATESRALRRDPRQPRIALATLGGGAVVFALDGGQAVRAVEGSFDTLAWDPAAGRLLSGGQDGVVRSHAAAGDDSFALPEPHADAVIALAVAAPVAAGPAAAAGSDLAGPGVAGPGGAVAVYSADTRGVIKVRGGGESGPFATASGAGDKPFAVGVLAISPDGRQLLAAGASGDVLVFDRATRKLLHRLETGADQLNGAGFSPDGRFVAAVDNVNRLHLWAAPQWQPYATLWLQHEPGRVGSDAFGRLGPLRQLAWLPDSRRIAIAAQSGAVLVVALPAPDAPAR